MIIIIICNFSQGLNVAKTASQKRVVIRAVSKAVNHLISSLPLCSSAHVDVNRKASLNTETSGNKSDKGSEKAMSRTRVRQELHATS